jgi:hypothetical protein
MGDKVNESQSFVQEDSFKDNYMQSGNTSALSSGTSKAKPIIPKVTIPYGEEEGGLKEKFKAFKEARKADFANYKGIFTGKSSFQSHARAGEKFGEEDQQESQEHVPDYSGVEIPAQKPVKEEMSMFALVKSGNTTGASHLSFLNMTQEMIDSKREAIIGHHKNDDDYEKIIQVLSSMKELLAMEILGSDDKMYKEFVGKILDHYVRTDKTLDEYIQKKQGAKTPSGMERLASVKVYKRLLNIDKDVFSTIANNTSFEEASKMSSYNDLIYKKGHKKVDEDVEKKAEVTEESQKATPEEEKAKELSLFPSGKSVALGRDGFERYKNRSGKGDKLYNDLVSFFTSDPIKDENDKPMDAKVAVDLFFAAFYELNLYDYVAPFDRRQNASESFSPGMLEAVKKLILSSKAANRYEYCKRACAFITGSSENTQIFANMMRYLKSGETTDPQFDGDDDDDDADK